MKGIVSEALGIDEDAWGLWEVQGGERPLLVHTCPCTYLPGPCDAGVSAALLLPGARDAVRRRRGCRGIAQAACPSPSANLTFYSLSDPLMLNPFACPPPSLQTSRPLFTSP